MPIIPSITAGAAAAAAKNAGMDEVDQLKSAFLADTLARAKNKEDSERAMASGAQVEDRLEKRSRDEGADNSAPENPYKRTRNYPSRPGALVRLARFLNLK